MPWDYHGNRCHDLLGCVKDECDAEIADMVGQHNQLQGWQIGACSNQHQSEAKACRSTVVQLAPILDITVK